MTRDDYLRLIAGIIAMGLLTLLTDVLADLIQAGTIAPVKERIKGAAIAAAQ
jgi:ABC-type antimicrobial peptide transport system permease subunit